MNDAGEITIIRRRRLEGNRARHDAPVKLGQHHIHGEIDGGQAPTRRLPLGAARGGEHGLKHRRVGAVEHTGAAIFAA